jgi:hypothetical protein
MPSLRDLPAALRELRSAALGGDADHSAAETTPAADDDTRLKMMSAMLGFGSPDWSTSAPADAGTRSGSLDSDAMAQAILGAIRPPQTYSGSAGQDDPATGKDTSDPSDRT